MKTLDEKIKKILKQEAAKKEKMSNLKKGIELYEKMEKMGLAGKKGYGIASLDLVGYRGVYQIKV